MSQADQNELPPSLSTSINSQTDSNLPPLLEDHCQNNSSVSENSQISQKSEIPDLDDDFETVDVKPSNNYTSPQKFSSLGFLLPIKKIRWFYDNKAMTAIYPTSLSAVNSEAARKAHRENQEKLIRLEWKPFNGNDSYRIEQEFRKIYKSTQNKQKSSNKQILSRVSVMGGMYEVEPVTKECYPIYWQGESIAVRRGVWFFENSWLPVGDNVSASVEDEHINRWCEEKLNQFDLQTCNLDGDSAIILISDPSESKSIASQSLKSSVKESSSSSENTTENQANAPPLAQTSSPKPSPRLQKPIIHRAAMLGYEVQWADEDNIWITSDISKSGAISGLLHRMTKKLVKLSRGYKENAELYDDHPPIDHVLFLVHGIGSYRLPRKIIRNAKILEAQSTVGKIEVLGIRWVGFEPNL